MKIHIDNTRCKGCGYRVEFCPNNVLKMSKEFNNRGYHFPVVMNIASCAGEGFCESICPDFALWIEQSNIPCKEYHERGYYEL